MVNSELNFVYTTTIRVSNGLQAASYYTTRLGFRLLGQRIFEDYIHYIIQQGTIIFILESSLQPNSNITRAVAEHGDHISDISFEVDDVDQIFNQALKRGARAYKYPWVEQDVFGYCKFATILGFGEITHTFIQRESYKGIFLPNIILSNGDKINNYLPLIELSYVDHIVINESSGMLQTTVDHYKKILNLAPFWTVDNLNQTSSVSTQALTNHNNKLQFLFAEPKKLPSNKKSQNQEFLDHYGGPGIHHIALGTSDIIASISNLKARGVEFLTVPINYYSDLETRLKSTSLVIGEDLSTLQELNILVDFDQKGYLLQIFAKPLTDRPTTFIEIIQRHNHNGYGAGNFKALYQAVEAEQAKRGNL